MASWADRALVTGAAGFVGRWLVGRLRGLGIDVEQCDLSLGSDIRHADLDALVPERGIVFHLAAVVGVTNVLRAPEDTWSTTVEGTEAVLRAALDRGATVVFTSSSEVYGDGKGEKLDERRSLPGDYGAWPRAAYPQSKLVAESLVLDFCQRGGNGRIARLFNVAGPEQDSAGGMVLPTLVERALEGLPLPVVGDGSDVRCFQHVDDAVSGLLALASEPAARARIVNLGGTESVTMRALAERVRTVLDSRSPIEHVSDVERYGAPTTRCRHRVPDTSLARELLGSWPEIDLDRTILDTARAICAASRVTLAS